MADLEGSMRDEDRTDEYGWLIATHVPHASLPDGFPMPELHKRDRQAFHHVGTGGWDGYMPPEDSALPPEVEWTEAHKILVLDAFNRKWGRFLEENQTYDIVWPPDAYLTTDGYVGTQPGGCEEHDDKECEVCDEFPEVPGDVRPAKWTWTARIETYEWVGDTGHLEESESFHFLTTRMDPRDVDYPG